MYSVPCLWQFVSHVSLTHLTQTSTHDTAVHNIDYPSLVTPQSTVSTSHTLHCTTVYNIDITPLMISLPTIWITYIPSQSTIWATNLPSQSTIWKTSLLMTSQSTTLRNPPLMTLQSTIWTTPPLASPHDITIPSMISIFLHGTRTSRISYPMLHIICVLLLLTISHGNLNERICMQCLWGRVYLHVSTEDNINNIILDISNHSDLDLD